MNDRKHTVFGEDDKAVVNSIEQNDTIKSISIEGDVTELMNNTQKNLKEWSSIIDGKFPEVPDA